MKYGNFLQQEQKTLISQNQVLSLRIMSMSNLELMQFLEEEALQNPLMELEPGEETVRIVEKDFQPLPKSEGAAVDGLPLMDYMAPQLRSAAQYLFEQIPLRSLSEESLSLLQYILELIDQDGYLRFSSEEISHLTHKPPKQVSRCIEIIKSLQPAGIGAANLQECLLLQLQRQGQVPDALRDMILFHMEDLASCSYRKIATGLHIPLQQIYKYAEQIRSLNPKPLNGIVEAHAQYLIPDVVLLNENGVLSVAMNDSCVGTIRLTTDYDQLSAQDLTPELRDYIKRNKRHASMLSRSIDQRRTTVLRCVRYIVDYQRDHFLNHGPLRGLTMKQVAGALALHESTVSRAINDKYIQTPAGTYQIKHLLPTAIAGTQGAVSTHEVKEGLKELIQQEDKQSPMSDRELSNKLADRGMPISRRTVAKYRTELAIPNERGRKKQ